MNESPKNFWKKSWSGPRLLYPWLVTAAILFLICFIIATVFPNQMPWLTKHGNTVTTTTLILLGASLAAATLIIGLWMLLRRLGLRGTVFALACLATLIGLLYAEEDWRGWHAWSQLKHQAEAQGEHFVLAALLPPPVPDDENFAMTPIAFSSYGYILTREGRVIPNNQRPTNFVTRMTLVTSHDYTDPSDAAGDRARGKFTDLKAWQTYFRKQAAKTNEFPVPPRAGSPAADVLLALGKYDPVIKELRTAVRLPASRFPLNYDSESPAAIYLPHLAALKSCARVLQLRSAAELQNGQPEQALADVQLGLALANTVRTEPFLITHLVRIAMVQLTLQTVWEGLAEHRWTDAQLAALEAALDKFDFPASYQLSLRTEIVCQNGEIERLRRHPEQLHDLMAFGSDENNGRNATLPNGFLARLVPSGWFYQNEYRCARIMLNFYLPVADVARGSFAPEKARAGDAAVAAETNSPSPYNMIEQLVTPNLGRAAERFAYVQTSVDSARTALALERYRLAHGEFPSTLDALVPAFLAKVPDDVMSGQPLEYHRETDGRFVIYSVGWNQMDDGGRSIFTTNAPARPKFESSSRLDFEQGDWVWQ